MILFTFFSMVSLTSNLESLVMLFVYMLSMMMLSNNLSSILFFDNLSLLFLIMTMMIMLISIFFFKKQVYLTILLMCLLKVFMTKNLTEIFIFFELSVAPLFFYIMKEGEYFGRVKASFYLLFYTIFMSMPFFIFVLFMKEFHWNFLIPPYLEEMSILSFLVFPVIMVKLPMFFLHIWLPKAHVESSTVGSMILAGIMLKISCYLLLRFGDYTDEYSINYFFWLCLISSIMLSILCLNLHDYKMIIAYSSIVHMAIIIINFLCPSKLYLLSLILLALAHSFISPNMFFLMGLMYENVKSKNNLINKGSYFSNKVISMIFFLIMISNFGFPPFLSFFSEIINIMLMFNMEMLSVPFMIFMMYLISLYSINLFMNSSFGWKNFIMLINSKDLILLIYMIFISIYFIALIFKILLSSKMIIISFILNLMQWNFLSNASIILEIKIFSYSFLNLSLMLLIDMYSIQFNMIILFIAGMIFMYTKFYMSESFNNKMFYWSFFMFLLFMIILIYSINMFSLILGWDGLGISSMVLIFFYGSKSSIKSSVLTFLVTRLGDLMLIFSIVMSMKNLFIDMNNIMKSNKMILTFLLLASFTKSAIYPFSAWLPMAMSAPTPVSSLVHSSTLVTAGIYLMIKFNFIIMKYMYVLTFYLSIFTMLLAGMIASGEKDMKKTIAMSTLSQMGFMMMMVSLGDWSYCFFHLIAHALFKSTLFLMVGIPMKNAMGEQDKRMIYLINNNPLVISTCVICCLSLFGLPFLSGFLMKDIFLESSFLNEKSYLFVFIFLACIFTCNYSIRILLDLIYYLPRGNKVKIFFQNWKFSLILFLMNFNILFMSTLMMNMFSYEEFFLVMKFDKIFIMMIYSLFVFFYTWPIGHVVVSSKFFLSMGYLVKLSYTDLFNFSKIKKINQMKMEKTWIEFYGGYFVEKFFNKTLKYSFMFFFTMKMLILTTCMVTFSSIVMMNF